jgi:hypothetical protein
LDEAALIRAAHALDTAGQQLPIGPRSSALRCAAISRGRRALYAGAFPGLDRHLDVKAQEHDGRGHAARLGTVAGPFLPFILRRLGFDPASASAPFVATLVDVTALVIYFSVSGMILQGALL